MTKPPMALARNMPSAFRMKLERQDRLPTRKSEALCAGIPQISTNPVTPPSSYRHPVSRVALCRLPDGGSRDPEKPLRRRPGADRRTATAACHVNSMRRSVSRVRQNPQEKCVLIAKSSALSTFDSASACLGAVRRWTGRSGGGFGLARSTKRSQAGPKPAAIWRMTG